MISVADRAKKINGYEKWELESAVRTLREAETIKADEKMMAAIQPMLEADIKASKNLRAELKKKRKAFDKADR